MNKQLSKEARLKRKIDHLRFLLEERDQRIQALLDENKELAEPQETFNKIHNLLAKFCAEMPKMDAMDKRVQQVQVYAKAVNDAFNIQVAKSEDTIKTIRQEVTQIRNEIIKTLVDAIIQKQLGK